jgi:hypothetical protein
MGFLPPPLFGLTDTLTIESTSAQIEYDTVLYSTRNGTGRPSQLELTIKPHVTVTVTLTQSFHAAPTIVSGSIRTDRSNGSGVFAPLHKRVELQSKSPLFLLAWARPT